MDIDGRGVISLYQFSGKGLVLDRTRDVTERLTVTSTSTVLYLDLVEVGTRRLGALTRKSWRKITWLLNEKSVSNQKHLKRPKKKYRTYHLPISVYTKTIFGVFDKMRELPSVVPLLTVKSLVPSGVVVPPGGSGRVSFSYLRWFDGDLLSLRLEWGHRNTTPTKTNVLVNLYLRPSSKYKCKSRDPCFRFSSHSHTDSRKYQFYLWSFVLNGLSTCNGRSLGWVHLWYHWTYLNVRSSVTSLTKFSYVTRRNFLEFNT